MTEEIIMSDDPMEPVDTGEETIVVDETPDAIKEIAKELGWNENPEDNPEKFVDAKTFILRSRDINSSLRKQIKEMNSVVSELKQHNERVYQAEVKRLTKELDDLKTQKKEAIEEGDVKRVEQIENQMDEIREKAVQKPSTPANTIFDDWLEDNQWYNTDEEMRQYADDIGNKLKGKADYDVILEMVKAKVVQKFPDRISGKKTATKPGASPVESGARKSGNTRSRSEADLSSEQRKIMNQFVKHGVMTKAEYIADLVKRGEI